MSRLSERRLVLRKKSLSLVETSERKLAVRKKKFSLLSEESDERRLAATLESLVKLSLKEDEEPLTLQVQSQTHGDIYYRTGRTVRLEHVMRDYCERTGFIYGEVRFLYDGKRVRPTHTPKELKMEDDFVIDAMSEQIGGSLFSLAR